MHEAHVFLVEVGFKVHRGMITEGAVEPLAVVKDFNPFKDGRSGFGPRGELAAMHEFAFEAAPPGAAPVGAAGSRLAAPPACLPPGRRAVP